MIRNNDTLSFDCGIATSRITAWLEDELALKHYADAWLFTAEDACCRITAEPLVSRDLGHFELERTLLTAEGDEEAVTAFRWLFTLRFMSAGG